MKMRCKDADRDDDEHTGRDGHHLIKAQRVHGIVEGCARKRGDGVYTFLQHHGDAPDKLIAHQTAANARDRTDEHGKKGVVGEE